VVNARNIEARMMNLGQRSQSPASTHIRGI
jgi:hypothetical protein